jgi:hypothetical protein
MMVRLVNLEDYHWRAGRCNGASLHDATREQPNTNWLG